MEKTPDPMPHALRSISRSNNWRKELAGTPTYFAAALLSWRYSEHSILGSLLIVICFLMIYAHIYASVFPQFDSTGRGARLIAFFLGQVAFWFAVFYVWFELLKSPAS